jgi:hypothetical protein
MDGFWYARYSRDGGREPFASWEVTSEITE